LGRCVGILDFCRHAFNAAAFIYYFRFHFDLPAHINQVAGSYPDLTDLRWLSVFRNSFTTTASASN
jgi:hypothetical protein